MKSKFNNIKAFVFDVEGVVATTFNDQFCGTHDPNICRHMHPLDQAALTNAAINNYKLAVMSRSEIQFPSEMCYSYGIQTFKSKVTDSWEFISAFMESLNLHPFEVMYLSKFESFSRSKGIVCACPSNADNSIKQDAHYVSSCPSGGGCLADVFSRVLCFESNNQNSVIYY